LPNPDKWPEDTFERAKKMWVVDGLSGSQIANQLGCGLTRSAVVSKLNRAGLKRNIVKAKCVAQRKRPNPEKISHDKATSVLNSLPSRPMRGPSALPTPPTEVSFEPSMEDSEIPLKQRRTVDTLESRECRWPCGDPAKPDFYFCGGKTQLGLPYCPTHARRAYVQVTPRRKSDVSTNKESNRVLEKEDVLD
jgi:GcrA cell cycle regulator